MIVIGTLTVRNSDEIIRAREKLRKISKILGFSNINATKIASLMSELSRELLLKSDNFNISIALIEENIKQLQIEFVSKTKISLSESSPYHFFFDGIQQESLKEKKGDSLILKKKISNQSFLYEKELLQKIKAEFNKYNKLELLNQLENKNIELQKAYEKLKTSQEELLNRTQHMANLGGWEIDIVNMSVEWTDQVSRIHELPLNTRPNVEEGIKFYAPEARPIITEAVNQAIEKGISYDLELPFITAKGNHRWVRAIGFPEKKGKKVVRLYGFFQDITVKKSAELSLERKNKELEQFVYIASHDLQEPLRTISNFINIIDTEYNNHFDELAQKSMFYIKEATNRMSNLIKGLLDYSVIGRNEELKIVDTQKIVDAVLNDLHLAISEKDAKVNVKKLPKVYGSESELRQLFQNLISNALKFTKPETRPIVSIESKKDNLYWQFSIKDNGIGIAKKHQEKIFKIFQRLHDKSKYKGTGIGLANCQKIVQLHQGKIWLDSLPNKGSTFYFTLMEKDKM
jgi:signal transduction histidine kinase